MLITIYQMSQKVKDRYLILYVNIFAAPIAKI